jgi:hypothetical protein
MRTYTWLFFMSTGCIDIIERQRHLNQFFGGFDGCHDFSNIKWMQQSAREKAMTAKIDQNRLAPFLA